MDPLVEAYSRLDAEKGERIDPVVMETAITHTRRFLVEVGLSSMTLLALSLLQVFG